MNVFLKNLCRPHHCQRFLFICGIFSLSLSFSALLTLFLFFLSLRLLLTHSFLSFCLTLFCLSFFPHSSSFFLETSSGGALAHRCLALSFFSLSFSAFLLFYKAYENFVGRSSSSHSISSLISGLSRSLSVSFVFSLPVSQ